MKNIFVGIVVASCFLITCTTTKQSTQDDSAKQNVKTTGNASSNEFKTSPSGLKYKITQQGTGIKPKTGDKVEVHYTGKLTNDTIFDSSIKRGQPLPFYLGKGMVIKGWDEGIALLNEGGKGTFIIPPDIAYGSKAMGKIPANSTLIFDVELVKVTPKVFAVPFDTKGKDTVKLASGLKYIIIKEGTGRVPFINSNITVHYTGYFEDGRIFDSSIERGQPYSFPVGKGKVIRAWDEAFTIFKVGTKARILAPSKLAYKESGYGKLIPPNTNLIFDVELIEYQ